MIQVALILLALYAGVGLYLYAMQRSIIFHPDRVRPSPDEWGVPEMAPVRLRTEDGLDLLAWWRPPKPGRPVLLYFHGNGGNLGYRADKIRPYLDAGYGVLLPAWRGYSGNPGQPSEAGLTLDAAAALAFLTDNGIAGKHLVIYGESLGTAVAVRVALEAKPAAIVLEAPFTSMPAMARHRYPLYPFEWLIKDRFDTLGRIGRLSAPLLVLHGERDRLIPAAMGRTLLDRAPGAKAGFFVPDAHHNDLYDYGAAGVVLDFIRKHVPRTD